jgi:hypothetical protein
VTLEQGVPHGLACAMWLPTAWQLAQGCDERVDRLLEQVLAGLDGGAVSSPGVARLQAWLASVGAVCDPVSHGVHDAEQRVKAALGSARGRNFIAA